MFKKLRMKVLKILLEENMNIKDKEYDNGNSIVISGTKVFKDSYNNKHELEIIIMMSEEVK